MHIKSIRSTWVKRLCILRLSAINQYRRGRVKARIEFKICLITFKALKFNQPSCIRELLSFSSHESTLGLRSADDPYRLHEPRAIGETGFANRSFSYIAPCLYNKLPITIKLIDSLRHFFFPVLMISQVLLFGKIMYCKFLVFLLIVFLFFSFFSSACEFRLIERIGAHGKQNPDSINIPRMIYIAHIPSTAQYLITTQNKNKRKRLVNPTRYLPI